MRLLIVEDEAVTALHLEALLRTLGYEVCSVEATGEGAIDAAGRHHPDLVLMDVRLAGKLDGISAAGRIRERFGIPSLLVTANTDAQTRARATDADALGLLAKPYSSRQIEQAIGELRGRAGGPEHRPQ